MKAPVSNRFEDRVTGKTFEADEVYESSEARIRELQGKGFLGEEVEDQKESLLDGNFEEVKIALDGLDQKTLKELLEEEKVNKNRKSVIGYIEDLLQENEEGDE